MKEAGAMNVGSAERGCQAFGLICMAHRRGEEEEGWKEDGGCE